MLNSAFFDAHLEFIFVTNIFKAHISTFFQTLKTNAHNDAQKAKHIYEHDQNELYFPFPVGDHQIVKIVAP